MSDLKACPFCGSDAEMVTNSSGDNFVRCTNRQCAAKTRLYHENENGARAAWNKRVERTGKPVPMDMTGNPPYNLGNIVFDSLVKGCSECGFPFGGAFHKAPRYCPNCGVRIVEGNE